MYVNLFPFNPLGDTAALTVTATTANVAVPSLNAGLAQNLISVRVVNVGTNPVFINFGSDNTVTSAIPTSGNHKPGVMLLPNTEKIFLVQNASFIAAIASTTGNTIYVTPGESE